MATKIEWCNEVWNPITGCSEFSTGCNNCYAKRMAKRLAGRCGYDKDDPFKVTVHHDKFDKPFKWKKAKRIFVNSMGDLFHSNVPEKHRKKVFKIMIPFLQSKKRLGENKNSRITLISLIAIILSFTLILPYSLSISLSYSNDTRYVAKRWILDNVPSGAVIAQSGYVSLPTKNYFLIKLDISREWFESG